MKLYIKSILINITLLFCVNTVYAFTFDPRVLAESFRVDSNFINNFIIKEKEKEQRPLKTISQSTASKFYKTWNQTFLTPKSFTHKQKPDSLVIDMLEFHFPYKGVVTSAYGARKKGFHYGYDIKLKIGDTIRCAFDGRVRIEREEKRGYGKYILIRHTNGLETIYAHLSKFLVKVNQPVYAGEPIALGGNTGRSSGPHLHFETRFLGVPINPGELVSFKNNRLLASTVIYTPKNKKITRVKDGIPYLTNNKIDKPNKELIEYVNI